MGLIINIRGTKIHNQIHAKMSLGRWTNVRILHMVITSEIIINKIQHRVKNFFLLYIPQSNVAIAKVIDTTAWSDGNELVGKISCRSVSSASTWFKTTIGLSL